MLLLVSMNNVEKFINLFECFSLISNNKSFEIIIILKIKKKRKRLNFYKNDLNFIFLSIRLMHFVQLLLEMMLSICK